MWVFSAENREMQHDVIVIGTGKLASNLIGRLAVEPAVQLFLNGRNKPLVKQLCESHTNVIPIELDDIPFNSLCILCVSDTAIASLAQELTSKNCFLIHCAGAVSIDVLIPHSNGAAVVWPLQSFSDHFIHWEEIPLIVELHNASSGEDISWLLNCLGGPVHHLNSERRKHLHLAAVMVNNFSNYLFAVAQEYCVHEGLPFETLKPLLQETIARIGDTSMHEYQTGPAIRGDYETISGHLKLIENNADAKSLYEFMTQAIASRKK